MAVAGATFTVQLHKGQRWALESVRRFVYMIAGSGGGKTVTGPIWLMQRITEHWNDPVERQQYLVASPNFPLLVRTTFPALRPVLVAIGAKWIAGERRFLLPTGGSVWVGSAENPQSLEGVHLMAAWCDEFGQVEDLAHDTVIRRLAFYEGRAIFTTTPYRATGWIRRIRDAAAAGDVSIEYIKFPSWWNPSYPLDEYLRLKATLPPWQSAMFLEAELARPEGAIYPIWDESRHLVKPFVIPDDWPRYGGHDAGVNNPTAAMRSARDGDDVLYLYEERFESGQTTPRHATWWKLDVAWRNGAMVFCDPSAKQVIVDLRAKDVSAYPAPNAVMSGIEEVYERLATDRLKVFAGTCVNFRREIEGYVWTPNKDAPVKENDHTMDAVRYLCMGVKTYAGGLSFA